MHLWEENSTTVSCKRISQSDFVGWYQYEPYNSKGFYPLSICAGPRKFFLLKKSATANIRSAVQFNPTLLLISRMSENRHRTQNLEIPGWTLHQLEPTSHLSPISHKNVNRSPHVCIFKNRCSLLGVLIFIFLSAAF